MKLSFSTYGWDNAGWCEFLSAAQSLKFQGVEIDSVGSRLFTEKGAAFYGAGSAKTARDTYASGITIPCIGFDGNPADAACADETAKSLKKCIETAALLKIPYVKIKADSESSYDEVRDTVIACIKEVIGDAEDANVTLLIETSGIFAETAKLRDFLEAFAHDNLAALWDLYSPLSLHGESPEETITNLGAYVKHVHIKDFNNDGFCLIGEGLLPINDMMLALRSVNFDGFISLEWDPAWLPELDDMEMIFSHFENFMSSFGDTRKAETTLYRNKAQTGKYVWKKETLIEATFSQVLDRMVEEFPDQYAIKYTTLDYTRTYSEFRDDVDTFARSLISLGVRPGHHVAVWATNIPQWYIAFWAVTKLGAVLVTMNTAYKIHEAEYLLKQSDTHTLIMIDGYRDSNYSEIMSELCPELDNTVSGEPLHSRRLPFLRNIITVGFEKPGCITWEDALQRAEQVPVEEVARYASKVSIHDVCNMQYTSGTTGFPKGVMLTHYNIVNNGKCIGDRMDLSTADRMMIQVPMFHCFGMVLAMTASMTHGATILPLPYFSPKPALACINNERITAFHGVPTMFIAMLEHEDFPKTDFSYMRTGIMAGSPCPISIMRDVVEKMHMTEIVIVYGQTEASPGCTMSSADDPLEVRVGTVGGNLPEIECKIVDPETGEECPDEVTGEFVARGYNIMKGYYKMPKATASAIDKDGWLHTGDLACRTPEGNYRITGRLKDMIIRGGENIYPKEIEEFIYTHPKVSDVQVIGVPDKQYGEEIMACIILKEGETCTAEEMQSYMRARIAKHKVPKYIEFVDEFPMNVAGKILKYKMREDAIKKLGLESADKIETA